MQELKRIACKKNIIIFLTCIAVNLFLFINAQRHVYNGLNLREYAGAYDRLLEACLQTDTENAEKLLEAYINGSEDYNNTAQEKSAQRLYEKLEYIKTYRDEIDYVIKNAENKSRFSVFYGEKSYSYYNIQKTLADFEKMTDMELPLQNDLAVEGFFDYKWINVVAFIFMLFILYQLPQERANGMISMTRTASGGRGRLAVCRQLIIAGLTALSVTVMYISTMICSFLIYGASDNINAPVQTLQRFSMYTHASSQLDFLIISCLKNIFVVYTIVCIVWLLLAVFKDRKTVIIIMAVICGAEYLFYKKIEIQSVYRMLRHINIFNLLCFNDISMGYLNTGIGSWVVSVEKLILYACAAVCITCSAAAVIFFEKLNKGIEINVLARPLRNIGVLCQKVVAGMPMLLKEIYKIVFSGSSVIIIVLLTALTVYFCRDSKMNFSQAQNQLDKKYSQMGGADYSELEEEALGIKERYIEVQNRKMQLVNYEGEEEHQAYSEALVESMELETQVKAYSEIYTKLSYLEELNASNGINGYMMSDRGYEELLGKYGISREIKILFCLSCAVILILSEGFRREYETKMASLLYMSANGRAKLFAKKMAAGIIVVSFLFVLTYGTDWFYLVKFYDFPYMDAPVQSLTFMRSCTLNINIMDYIALQFIMVYLFVMTLAAFICCIMIFVNNKNEKAGISVAVVISMLCSWAVLKWGMLNPLAAFIVMAVLLAAFTLLSGILWCRCKVR